MSKPSCQQEFKRGSADRLGRPLPHGRYRLVQLAGWLERDLEDVTEIRQLVSGRSRRQTLNGCTSEDKHLWLKGLPTHIAYLLGYDLLPGLAALPEDGAPLEIVSRLIPILQADCVELVERLEHVRLTIKRSVGIEYDCMRSGQSMLEPPLRKALRMIDSSLECLDAVPG